MSKKTTELPHAAVARLARVKPGLRVESGAIDLAISKAEQQIKDMFTASLTFMEHRNGTMLMKKDVETYRTTLKQ
jgi:histone H3/H4